MKKLLILSTVVFLLSACLSVPEADEIPAEAPIEDLVEDAAEPEEYQAVARQVTVTKPFVQKEIRFDSDAYKEHSIRYFYDMEDSILLKEEHYNTFDELIESIIYEYQDSLLIKRSILDSNGNLVSYRSYAYNEPGWLTEERLYNRQNRVQTISRTHYDTFGNKVQWDVLDADNTLLSRTEYLWDAERLQRINLYDASNILFEYFTRDYDSQGRLIKESNYEGGDVLRRYISYTYTGSEYPESTRHYLGNNALVREVQFEYDEAGGLVKESYFNSLGELREYYIREFKHIDIEITIWE